MADTAFEAVVSKSAWYANETIARYAGVMIDTDGKYAKADGSRPLAGICQYGGASGEMVTVVKGMFPAVAAEVIDAGDLVKLGATDDAGKFFLADAAADVAYGIAITAAAAVGDLFTVQTLDAPIVVS